MDKKKELIEIVKQSDLPEDVKNDLVARIEAQGVTETIAKEVADLLDLQADVFEAEATIAKDREEAYTELAGKLDEADKVADEALNKIADEADKQIADLETSVKSHAVSADDKKLQEVRQNLPQPPQNSA